MSKRSTKLEALNDIFKENDITQVDIAFRDDLIREIKKNADAIPDYRHPSYIRHLVGDIVMIVFFALLGNADEWSEVESFARRKEKWLRRYLELPNGVPTDDTIRIVTGNINTEHFFQVAVHLLLETIDGIARLSGKETHEKEIVCVDGKESCGSGRRGTGKGVIHGLSGFGKIHKEQGDRCGYNGGNGGDPYDLSIDVLHDRIRFGPHVRGIGLVGTQSEEVGEGCGFCQEFLAGDAEFLAARFRLFGGLTIFFVFQ